METYILLVWLIGHGMGGTPILATQVAEFNTETACNEAIERFKKFHVDADMEVKVMCARKGDPNKEK